MKKGTSLSINAFLSLTLLFIGIVGFRLLEKWSWIDCFYASTGVITTVGIFITPQTNAGTFFTCLLNFASLGIVASWCSEIAENRMKFWSQTFPPTRRSYNRLLALLFAAIFPMIVTTVMLSIIEKWSFSTSAFLTFCCGTGLGMADMSPQTAIGKLILSFYCIINMGTVLILCIDIGSMIHDAVINRNNRNNSTTTREREGNE